MGSIPDGAEANRDRLPGHDHATPDAQFEPISLGPREEYEKRVAAARTNLSRHEHRVDRLANARLFLFLAVAIVIWLAWEPIQIAWWWILAPVVLFGCAVRAFDKAERDKQQAARLVAHYESGLARLNDRWAGQGNTGNRFRDPEHLYCDDLDMFGPGSLFERVSMVRTHAGENTLAEWLLQPASVDEIRRRQAAVAELRPRLDLREDLAVLGPKQVSDVAFEGLAEWGSSPCVLRNLWARFGAAVLALAAIAALTGWLFGDWGTLPIVVVALGEGAVGAYYLSRVRLVLGQVEKRARELDALSGMLQRLEQVDFQSAALGRLLATIRGAERPASRRIDALARLVATLDARRNMLLGPISPLLMWGTQIAFAIEGWRMRSGGAIGGWLAAIGQFEALSSLACFAFENPDDVFPTLVDARPARFVAKGLGHPLLSSERLVRNDLSLGGPDQPHVLIVSGSNMSGKSTLLRSVGAAIVLALAGGTVRARSLSLSNFALGATLRVQDSLMAGRSRFYAEILRLRRLLETASGNRPLLFLLDEILGGTNSHDRRIGAMAIVAGLAERGAIGLVTTHDLALSEIANRLGPMAANVHFADHMEDGRMIFDYALRPGAVTHSNALALMRSVGLDV